MQEAQVERFKKLETKILPEDISYEEIKGISLEGRQKLDKFKPYSIGQASRISGVSPADISVLLVYLEQKEKRKGDNMEFEEFKEKFKNHLSIINKTITDEQIFKIL